VLVLLWGLPDERPFAAVLAALEDLGTPTVVVDQHEVLDTEIDLTVGVDVQGWLRTPRQHVDLAAVTGVYVRPYDLRRLPALVQADPARTAWQHAELVDDVLWSWLGLTPALVVNRPAAMATNGSKPYQLELIRDYGFRVPETLVTTDPAAAEAFWAEHGNVIYKSVSGHRSIVSRLVAADKDRLADVVFCPTQFQRYIRGYDYRVHVVGAEVFACEIVSEADDYRSASASDLAMRACELPDAVADRCRGLAAALDLPVAGIDLRRGPDEQWYCFEVNPSPAFTYYQRTTRQPISHAIARLLTAAAR
jgi:hypothetical protein